MQSHMPQNIASLLSTGSKTKNGDARRASSGVLNRRGLAEFFGPSHVFCGGNAIEELNSLVRDFSSEYVLVVADQHVLGNEKFRAALGTLSTSRRVDIAEHDGSEPSIAQAMRLKDQAKGTADLIVAVGGGSTIDIAKALAIASRAGTRSLSSFEGANRIDFEPVPIVAVPTTAGTGSEVTGSCVLTDYEAGRKISIRSPKLQPKLALLDPGFLPSVPRSVIRATGIDALAHAVEAYFSSSGNTVTDRLALGALALIARSITKYYSDPSDSEACTGMAVGSCMAGMAFNSARVGVAHAIASAIGPLTGLSHGMCVGLALPSALRTNSKSLGPSDQKDLLFHAGLLGSLNKATWGQDLLDWLTNLYHQLDFPITAVAAGHPFDIDDQLLNNIVNSGRLETNPIPIDVPELRELLRTIRG